LREIIELARPHLIMVPPEIDAGGKAGASS
jgi:hypothetical protein